MVSSRSHDLSEPSANSGLSALLLSQLRGSCKVSGAYILHSQSLPHAVGVAKSLAALAVCLGTRDPSCPCGNCRRGLDSCQDVFHVKPNEHGNVLAGSFTGLQEFLTLPPLTGCQVKVLLVDAVDKVTTTSASSMLKLLEDRVTISSTLVLFTTASYGSVPAPLRSRAVSVPLPMQEAAPAGSSLTSQDLTRSSRWLSAFSSGATADYTESRKALHFIIGGIKASDPVRSWKSLAKVSKGESQSLATAEVLSVYFSDLLAVACAAPGLKPTITESDKDQAAEDATAWGVSALASLLEDLSSAVSGRLPGQDLSSFLYRWMLKACGLASGRTFKKAVNVQVLETSTKRRDQVLMEEEPSLALDGDESFTIDFGDC